MNDDDDAAASSDSRLLNPDSFPSVLLITGPNMAGKSTYIRQTALLQLMAQVGSFVPAKNAVVGIADRIFARVGASDDLARGRSTFMVEMTETARILNTATARSLVILDEIGRGTSTYDGLSLAWAVVEHLHDQIGCRTLFATHYHELTQLSKELPQLANFNVAVREWQDQVVFLHQIVPGAAEKSFGIHVAQLAGVPREVNQRAEQILASLEKGSAAASLDRSHEVELSRGNEAPGESGDLKSARRRKASQLQMTLFEYSEHPLLEAIRGVDLDVTTPRDAMNLIDHWQGQLLAESNGPAQTA